MNWDEFKVKSEQLFEDRELEECWGFQIQPGTKWNTGLNSTQIKEVENLFGFEFPDEYRKMLFIVNGFDRDEISIDPDRVEDDEYKYPDDFTRARWLIEEINTNSKYVNQVLVAKGFNANDVVGFIPLYVHRALVVFTDKSLSPVISVHGNDVIVYGMSLVDYWCREFGLENEG
jgi:hypothetical protein